MTRVKIINACWVLFQIAYPPRSGVACAHISLAYRFLSLRAAWGSWPAFLAGLSETIAAQCDQPAQGRLITPRVARSGTAHRQSGAAAPSKHDRPGD